MFHNRQHAAEVIKKYLNHKENQMVLKEEKKRNNFLHFSCWNQKKRGWKTHYFSCSIDQTLIKLARSDNLMVLRSSLRSRSH